MVCAEHRPVRGRDERRVQEGVLVYHRRLRRAHERVALLMHGAAVTPDARHGLRGDGRACGECRHREHAPERTGGQVVGGMDGCRLGETPVKGREGDTRRGGRRGGPRDGVRVELGVDIDTAGWH